MDNIIVSDDKIRQSKYHKKWYEKNKLRRIAQCVAEKQRKRDWLLEYKKTLSCSKCGESHPACLEFHHINPETKEGDIASFAIYGWGIEKIKSEISKCTVLCANCHRKVHFDGI
jgi:hypothetical protein